MNTTARRNVTSPSIIDGIMFSAPRFIPDGYTRRIHTRMLAGLAMDGPQPIDVLAEGCNCNEAAAVRAANTLAKRGWVARVNGAYAITKIGQEALYRGTGI